MADTFEGKVVLVTGAAGGIGEAVCLAFADAGAIIVLTDAAEIAHPSVIDTDMTRAAPPEQRDTYPGSIPLGRFGSPSEVARPIVFPASRAAAYITGVTLDINGGLLMD